MNAMPSKDRMNAVHPERSRNVSRYGMKLIIPHNGHITNENRADRRARNLISDLICCYRGFSFSGSNQEVIKLGV